VRITPSQSTIHRSTHLVCPYPRKHDEPPSPTPLDAPVPLPPSYAHNTLVDLSTGRAKLSDFGAAFYFGAASHGRAYDDGVSLPTPAALPHARAYEAIEARAYGILLQELLQRHNGTGDAGAC
jgi:hypothetical protein